MYTGNFKSQVIASPIRHTHNHTKATVVTSLSWISRWNSILGLVPRSFQQCTILILNFDAKHDRRQYDASGWKSLKHRIKPLTGGQLCLGEWISSLPTNLQTYPSSSLVPMFLPRFVEMMADMSSLHHQIDQAFPLFLMCVEKHGYEAIPVA